MSNSPTRQHYSLATGSGLAKAPSGKPNPGFSKGGKARMGYGKGGLSRMGYGKGGMKSGRGK
jgi:hypothetical protein